MLSQIGLVLWRIRSILSRIGSVLSWRALGVCGAVTNCRESVLPWRAALSQIGTVAACRAVAASSVVAACRAVADRIGTVAACDAVAEDRYSRGSVLWWCGVLSRLAVLSRGLPCCRRSVLSAAGGPVEIGTGCVWCCLSRRAALLRIEEVGRNQAPGVNHDCLFCWLLTRGPTWMHRRHCSRAKL